MEEEDSLGQNSGGGRNSVVVVVPVTAVAAIANVLKSISSGSYECSSSCRQNAATEASVATNV